MKKSLFNPTDFLFLDAYNGDADLKKYGSNALGLFALSLYLRIEDIDDFASRSITDGGDDKKVDLCYLNEDDEYAIIAQNYISQTWGKQEAPQNKAGDLHQAVAWLFTAYINEIPVTIRNKAIELRNALHEGSIKRIEILYIHNCFESKNVEVALKTVAMQAEENIRVKDPNNQIPVQVSYREIGLKTIDEFFRSRESDILIEDWMKIPIKKYVQEDGPNWKSLLATVPGEWIRELYNKYGDRLFSANYRSYMSFIKSKDNINNIIIQTASEEPENFFVYNNGLTALTYKIALKRRPFKIQGISIINGAQTTGSLAEVVQSCAEQARVLIRFVECQSPDIVSKIILYNNTQNEIKPSDRRSKDPKQKRIGDEFSQYKIQYVHRRSSTRVSRSAITTAAIGPALCAFHGDPQTAYRNSKEIFNNETVYQKVFPDRITAKHIFLVKALSSAFDRIKAHLGKKSKDETATDTDQQMYSVMQYSASKHFVNYLMGYLAEELMGQKVTDLFAWKCVDNVLSPDNTSLIEAWESALYVVLHNAAAIIITRGQNAFYEVQRSHEMTKDVAQELKGRLAGYGPAYNDRLKDLRKRSSL